MYSSDSLLQHSCYRSIRRGDKEVLTRLEKKDKQNEEGDRKESDGRKRGGVQERKHTTWPSAPQSSLPLSLIIYGEYCTFMYVWILISPPPLSGWLSKWLSRCAAAWCCVVLRGAAWCCVVLRGTAWCCMMVA